LSDRIRESIQGARVLIIEDNAQVRRSLVRALKPYDLKLHQSDSGLDGFDEARNSQPDAILLDLGLPDIDGAEVLQLLKGATSTAEIPVLILTGRADPSVHARVLEAGADDFISKPFDPRILLARLANLVGRARAERANRRLLQQLSRYVSKPVRRRGTEQARPERLTATILVSDLRGFTAASFHTDVDAMFRSVSRVLAEQAEVVEHFGGYVDKFSGDGMLAVFVDPTSAQQAVSASRAILRWARDSDEIPVWQPIPLGIGVHTGTVIRGDLGSDERRDHTVLGPAVNVAARLCAVADPLEAIVSDKVVQLIEASNQTAFQWSPVNELVLKGLPGPLSTRSLII